MKCYDCAQQGKDVDTIGICILCGRGICKEHSVREDLPIMKGEYDVELKCGMGVECSMEDMQHLPKMLCPTCHKAIKENY